MNSRESVAVVALFQGAWGHVEVDERMIAVWHDVLREIPATEAEEVARKLVRESPHFPAPSAFYAAWKAHRRHAGEVANFQRPAIESGATITRFEDARERMAEIRGVLASTPRPRSLK